MNGDEAVGVFNAVSAEREAFDEAERKFLLSLAGVVAVSIGFWHQRGLESLSGPTATSPSLGETESQ